ncbi:hypothetical protein GCM10009865_54680 [Aeromicrobium ponti]|uniref:Tn3 transposase DDE domain-containing protein n=1 Tax=Cytobacillus oceanisediminis TaxID=665099 RepID=A0A562J3D2_9BACI|nr:Tn3 transposase DDE domain-containing protein [Cytobacillus oceanisediminis]
MSGSLILGKLGSYAKQNKLANTLHEMGRIEKANFILDYISNEDLRRRIQRGLNKGEAMNGLVCSAFSVKYCSRSSFDLWPRFFGSVFGFSTLEGA